MDEVELPVVEVTVEVAGLEVLVDGLKDEKSEYCRRVVTAAAVGICLQVVRERGARGACEERERREEGEQDDMTLGTMRLILYAMPGRKSQSLFYSRGVKRSEGE